MTLPPTASAAAIANALRESLVRLRRRMRPEPGALGWPHASVLAQIAQAEPTTVGDLARKAGLRQQSMGALVAELAAADLVRSVPDPADRRRTRLTLTAAGRRQLDARYADDWLALAIARDLAPEDRGILIRALPLLDRLSAP